MTEFNKNNHTLNCVDTNKEMNDCPNCWGKSEYGGISCNENVVNEKQKGWIQNYAEKKLLR